MNILRPLFGLGTCFILVSAFSADPKSYHCISGQVFGHHILESNLHIKKYKKSYLSTMEWNNGQVGHGRLHPSQIPDVFIEQWSSVLNNNRFLGISVWKFEAKSINIKYNYIDEKTSKFYEGEINCRH